MPQTILIVDDDASILRALSRTLAPEGYRIVLADCGGAALDALASQPVDLMLLDLNLPDQDGLSVLSAMQATGPRPPVLMMSGQGSIEIALKSVELGACDFIEKPFTPERVTLSIANALKFAALADHNAELVRNSGGEEELLGESPPMRALRALIERAAPTDGRVLIGGDNGTGKELVARALHRLSRRASSAFVKVNCAAIPGELIESELFGHEKGAFTGAVRARRGKFEAADGGTLFLDEVGEMSAAMQAKVLRALQDGEIERVGATAVVHVDVRVIAATNRKLEDMLAAGTFREDLFYRLNVIRIEVPPLRERKDDIPLLARRFLGETRVRNDRGPSNISDAALAALARHNFPGNVRELRNLVERIAILAPGDTIEARDVETTLVLPAVTATATTLYRPGVRLRDLVAAAERNILTAALRDNDYAMARTARALGLERSHLYKKCRVLGIATLKKRR